MVRAPKVFRKLSGQFPSPLRLEGYTPYLHIQTPTVPPVPSPISLPAPAAYYDFDSKETPYCLASKHLEPGLRSPYNLHKLIFSTAFFSSIKKILLYELHKVSYSQQLHPSDPNFLPFRNVLISNPPKNIIALSRSAQHVLVLALHRDSSGQLL